MSNEEQRTLQDLPGRIFHLERRLRRMQCLNLLLVCIVGIGLLIAADDGADATEIADEIRTHRLIVLDDQNVPRVVIGQDPKGTERRSRAAGITIHDRHGHERGGMGTFDDDSVVIALDAPHGVGAAMPDRAGLMVYPNGAADFMLLDNETRAIVKLASDGKGGGGVQTFDWHTDDGYVTVKTTDFHGEQIERVQLGEPQ